jgi:hypothetical protein
MKRATKRAGLVVTLLTMVTMLVPATASASPPIWYSNPANCTKVATVAEGTSNGRFVQLRRGICGGTHYIWARANSGYVVELGVLNSSGRVIASDRTQNGSGNTHYTRGYRSYSNNIYVADVSWTTSITF